MTSWNHVCFIIVIIAIVGVIMIDKIYPSPTQPTPIITLTLPNHIGNNNTVNSNNPITTTTPVNTTVPVAWLPVLLPDGTTAYVPAYK